MSILAQLTPITWVVTEFGRATSDEVSTPALGPGRGQDRRVSTRKLIVAAMVTGLIILVAGAVLLIQVGRQEPRSKIPPSLPPEVTNTTRS